ncbi:complex I NDUFA9 subunit family protein [Wenzhouxiangella marina]|uniref:Epimerase n=1 Tax=Wenzhouxiangella marina TaxID=1579979 RepID=A0A0K0XZ16_9GAMM|nr:complex I NDUFA9 subunit family protein [Wenzhouxiangella marina]AKS42915.1 epimerase [Wenzhouxiangella marina]MBB6087402.1 NADH dehydrogenase [Wenzhouxiangella marina]
MNVFILGGSGFVGGHLARRLAAEGHQVTIATRYPPAARHLQVIPGLKIARVNPYDLDSLTAALEGQDVAINLVGILNERGFGGRGFKRAHVELVEKLIISCEAARVRRLIQMSAINAGLGDSHYLRTRGQAEELVMGAWRDGQLNTTIFRPSVIFGPDDSFINRFAGLLKLSPVLPLARPNARFAPVYVGDVAEAFARAVSDESTHGRIYELCGSELWSLKEMVRWVRDQLGLKRMVVGLPDALGRLQALAFDFVPGKPFSSDNYKSLKHDSVCTDNGLIELGIEPWGLSQLAPSWLGPATRQQRYQAFRRQARRGGH